MRPATAIVWQCGRERRRYVTNLSRQAMGAIGVPATWGRQLSRRYWQHIAVLGHH
jgi:hypothetical protein